MTAKMSELNLLIECINTEGEAEDGGIKYIYMDPDTIYRFENNRMKKISKALINKARKQLKTQNEIPAAEEPKPKPKPKSKSIEVDDEDEVDEEETERSDAPAEAEQIPKKRSLRSKPKSKLPATSSAYTPNINLDEYYNNKNRMEYMNLEITRLNSKIDKLKQYKAIVNKLTGNEFDIDVPKQDVGRPAWQKPQQLTSSLNDTLFLY